MVAYVASCRGQATFLDGKLLEGRDALGTSKQVSLFEAMTFALALASDFAVFL